MEPLWSTLLAQLEFSALGVVARHSTWLYPACNLLHVLGVALLVGAIAVLDLRLLGLGRGLAADALAGITLPLAIGGLVIIAPTGLVLLAAEATAIGHNPAFQIKMLLVALALVNVALFHRAYRGAWQRVDGSARARVHGLVSITGWVLVLLAGRFIAYI